MLERKENIKSLESREFYNSQRFYGSNCVIAFYLLRTLSAPPAAHPVWPSWCLLPKDSATSHCLGYLWWLRVGKKIPQVQWGPLTSDILWGLSEDLVIFQSGSLPGAVEAPRFLPQCTYLVIPVWRLFLDKGCGFWCLLFPLQCLREQVSLNLPVSQSRSAV